MEELKKHELFDAYIRGELDQNELDAFLERLKTDEGFKEAFDMYQYLVEGIREHEKQELKAYMSQKKKQQVGYIGSPWSKSFTYAAAAILTGFGVLYVVLDNQVKDQGVAVNSTGANPKIPESVIVPGEDDGGMTESGNHTDPEESTPIVDPDSAQWMPQKAEEYKGAEKQDSFSSPKIPEYPSVGDQSRMASSGDEYPVKEDSRIMDTIINLSIQFEMETHSDVDSGYAGEAVTKLVNNEKILVQFWESPINYKGYRFDGRKLVLFGLDTFSQVSLKYRVLDAELKVYDLYLVYGKMHVKLIDNNRYNAYIRETNPAILNELK